MCFQSSKRKLKAASVYTNHIQGQLPQCHTEIIKIRAASALTSQMSEEDEEFRKRTQIQQKLLSVQSKRCEPPKA